MRPDADPFRIRLKFWGVRGSTPTPQKENLGYGGNTPCVEIRTPGNEVLILDGGTGLRPLGDSLLGEFREQNLRLNFFASHFHWDHIQGIPFFVPLYIAGNELIFHSGSDSTSLEQALQNQMTSPFFPVLFEALASRRSFVRMDSAPLKCAGLAIHPFATNHPQGSVGYRIEAPGAVVVYATDLEHGDRKLDSLLREYAQDADVLIYDAQYSPEEYPFHKGWGHSTWEQGVGIAQDARAKQLILFHHDPSHDDPFVDKLVQNARRRFENTAGAREGLVISL